MPIENEIARDILAYLVEHPEAQDTLDGITRWWLLEQKIKYKTEMIQEALEELENSGLICLRKIENSRTGYRINQERVDAIKKLLRKG